MTYEEARAVVDRISHPFMLFILEKAHPFDTLSPDSDVVKLLIHHKCADAKTLEPIVIRRSRQMILHFMDEGRLVDEVWRCVKNAALHEAGEYFRYEGRAIHDPHEPAAV